MESAARAFEEGNYAASKASLASCPAAGGLSGVAAGVARRRMRHNQALVEYCAAAHAQRKPDKLLAQLDELDDDDSATAVERAALRYNRAVLRVQLHRYTEARKLLEPLLALKDVIEADICIKIVMLLLDIAIRQKRTQQAVLVFEDLCCIQEMIKSGSQNSASSSGSTRSMTAVELSFWIRVYSARVLILTDNHKAAKKELKNALQIFNRDNAPESGSPTDPPPLHDLHKASALILKARLEASRDNAPKAIKLLNNVKFCYGTQESVSAVYLNNLGCLHYQLKSYSAAGFYFSKALGESRKACKSAARSGGEFVADHCTDIIYNVGLQLVETKAFEVAFRCLQMSVNTHASKNPVAWIRMGECQLQQFTDWQESQLSALTRHSSGDASNAGGPRLDLVTSPYQPPPEVLQALVRALSFYRNAQLLCTDSQQQEWEAATLGIAYALLRLERFSACLSALRALPARLQESVHVRLFTAEALAKLARTKDAIAVLESTTGDSSTRLELHLNLCAAFCMQGALERALSCALKAQLSQPKSLLPLRSLSYVLLRMNRTEEAVFVLQKHCVPPLVLEQFANTS